MQGPGITVGSQGDGKAVYFKDPSGHVLEIKTY
jgi:extradiol dioxygenase family protein